MRFRGRRDELERQLHEERPEPRDELVSKLTGRLTPEPPRRRGWSFALAMAFTTVLVVAFAATGGIGYAASCVEGGTHAVTKLVTRHTSSHESGKWKQHDGDKGKSGSNRHHKQPVCHVPPGNPDNARTINVDDSAVPAHLAHGDSRGECHDHGSPPDDQYKDKVLICHRPPGNPGNAHTIRVSVNAVPAHLAHGDTLGPCPKKHKK